MGCHIEPAHSLTDFHIIFMHTNAWKASILSSQHLMIHWCGSKSYKKGFRYLDNWRHTRWLNTVKCHKIKTNSRRMVNQIIRQTVIFTNTPHNNTKHRNTSFIAHKIKIKPNKLFPNIRCSPDIRNLWGYFNTVPRTLRNHFIFIPGLKGPEGLPSRDLPFKVRYVTAHQVRGSLGPMLWGRDNAVDR